MTDNMNESWVKASQESIKQQRNDESKLAQLRGLITGERNEYEKLVAGMNEPGVSDKDLGHMSEFKQDFEKAIIRKSQEIIPLLEKELEMYQEDLSATEKHLLQATNSETSTKQETANDLKIQTDYLTEKVNNLNQEIADYRNILLTIEASQSPKL